METFPSLEKGLTSCNSSSITRVEALLEQYINEVKSGHRENSIISSPSFVSTPADVWDLLRRELEDVGISPEVLVEHRQHIISYLLETMKNGRLDEHQEIEVLWTEEPSTTAEEPKPDTISTRTTIMTSNQQLTSQRRDGSLVHTLSISVSLSSPIVQRDGLVEIIKNHWDTIQSIAPERGHMTGKYGYLNNLFPYIFKLPHKADLSLEGLRMACQFSPEIKPPPSMHNRQELSSGVFINFRERWFYPEEKKFTKPERPGRLALAVKKTVPKWRFGLKFHQAVREGDWDLVRELAPTTKDVDLSEVDIYKRTALHIALDEGHEDIALYLIKRGANEAAGDIDGITVMDRACARGCSIVLHKLLKTARLELIHPPGSTRTATPLYYAVIFGQAEIVSTLMDDSNYNKLLSQYFSIFGRQTHVNALDTVFSITVKTMNHQPAGMVPRPRGPHTNEYDIVYDVCGWITRTQIPLTTSRCSPLCLAAELGNLQIITILLEKIHIWKGAPFLQSKSECGLSHALAISLAYDHRQVFIALINSEAFLREEPFKAHHSILELHSSSRLPGSEQKRRISDAFRRLSYIHMFFDVVSQGDTELAEEFIKAGMTVDDDDTTTQFDHGYMRRHKVRFGFPRLRFRTALHAACYRLIGLDPSDFRSPIHPPISNMVALLVNHGSKPWDAPFLGVPGRADGLLQDRVRSVLDSIIVFPLEKDDRKRLRALFRLDEVPEGTG